ncbi:hypothetical protein CHS0354_039721 [Potamilus streckersoni]|uniref:28S ribosomal protein S22, mitochondrial n=1 Tax=Potamilus streckersoni TaxID=2493646 RepID=A0AAE0W408_9BIVA|nr:hypothetical protein CHS0354_039721 [Potamilus streckersoni]
METFEKAMRLTRICRMLYQDFKRNKYLRTSERFISCTSIRCDDVLSSGRSTKVTEDRDPLPLFMSEEVQTWLQKMTGFDIEKICAPRPFEADKPTYRLLTNDELEKEKKKAIQIAKRRIQMPPVMKMRDGTSKVLQKDPDLNMFSKAKHVFTDISFGLKDRKRFIVVREPDGTLRTATDKEHDRLNQIYNPQQGRAPVMPRMFEEEYLEKTLEKGQYRYILDRACVQFDPDNPDFIRVAHRTYEAVCERHMFDVLRSTRHFGPMAFYFAWYKKIEPLLADMVQRDLLSDAVDLIKLYFKIHQELSSTVVLEENIDELHIIKNFCEKMVKNPNYKGQLQLAIQAYEAALTSQAKRSQSKQIN